ncbi:hypothetical protein [Virgibacillus oceani]|uniref:Uncharacterized protein n=1 Tax=Virgibacillus oceani TaxID=1479511 RepID=A0A917M567_9BACI|nr:hypothetical protein [Virgibacillus oceani]GGG77644.1 hypothetical protein GCM10011398_23490 [Virgibacillus oceani]
MNSKIKIRIFISSLILVIIVLIIMLFTAPSHEKFDSWILQEYSIECDNEGCVKDNERLSISSAHFRDAGIFASYE